jgi:tetratricopeptide (TPR) repeat protein
MKMRLIDKIKRMLGQNSPDKHYRAAMRFYKKHKYREAVLSFCRVIDADPKNAAAMLHQAKCHEEMGEVRQALESYDRCVAVEPTNGDAWFGRIGLLLNSRRTQEALASCEKCLALEPSTATVWYYRGRCLWFLGRHREALESYDRCLRLNPPASLRDEALRERFDVEHSPMWNQGAK